MFISYAICTHNEGQYISDLLNVLVRYISRVGPQASAEIVILDDISDDPKTQMILRNIQHLNEKNEWIKVLYKKHTGDFSEQKNYLNHKCSGDWIFNLDADEFVTEYLLSILPEIIKLNPDIDAYWLPRVNTVSGLTEEHVKKWNWSITTLEGFQRTEKIDTSSDAYKLLKNRNLIVAEGPEFVTYNPPIIMWPDYQLRLYRNRPEIKWTKPVHEQLEGYKKVSFLPSDPHFAIRHFKDIKRQEAQNESYDKYNT